MGSLNGITVKGLKSTEGLEGIVWAALSCLMQFGRIRGRKN